MKRLQEGIDQGPAVALLAVASLALAWRMFSFISEHAVNILYWDLWDIYPILFIEGSWWDVVRTQAGKTRQGPGFLLTRLIADFTAMDTRAESYAIGALLCVSLVLAIVLKRSLTGRFDLTDFAIPFIVLTTVQQDTWVGTPNLSVAAVPIMLLLLICLAFNITDVRLRVPALVVLSILLVNSGYGVVGAPLVPALFTTSLIHRIRLGERQQALWMLAGLLGSLAAVPIQLYGMVFDFSYDCPLTSFYEKLMMPGFVVLMLGKFVGLDFDIFVFLTTIAGTVLLFAMAFSLMRHTKRLLRSENETSALSRVIVLLIGFSLLYAFLTAYGRICQSFMVAQLSRYMTFLIPGFLGLYLDILTSGAFRWRRVAMATFVAGVVIGGLSVDLITDDDAARLRDRKLRWKECYLATEDVGLCNGATGGMHPLNNEHLAQKLEYLKENRLNLYSGR